jgi:hypothetical protein
MDIYDIRGVLAARLPVANNTAAWQAPAAAGKYFARITDGKRSIVKPFVFVK